MIVVQTIASIVTVSENGGAAQAYSPSFVVSTVGDGSVRITNTGDGSVYQGAFTEWTVDGKSFPELPDRVSVVLALAKTVSKWIAL